MNKGRVQAITDGIIAIAATIMVLELGVPRVNNWTGLVDLRHTFLAYIISFFTIYIVWSMHHDLFHHAKQISKKAFMVNGIWVFFLTLVPFSTEWVGNAPYDTMPEFAYPFNLLLWSAAFQWLEHQVHKDNPEMGDEGKMTLKVRILMYAGFIVCMVMAFIKPVISMYLIGISTVVLFILIFTERKRNAS